MLVRLLLWYLFYLGFTLMCTTSDDKMMVLKKKIVRNQVPFRWKYKLTLHATWIESKLNWIQIQIISYWRIEKKFKFNSIQI